MLAILADTVCGKEEIEIISDCSQPVGHRLVLCQICCFFPALATLVKLWQQTFFCCSACNQRGEKRELACKPISQLWAFKPAHIGHTHTSPQFSFAGHQKMHQAWPAAAATDPGNLHSYTDFYFSLVSLAILAYLSFVLFFCLWYPWCQIRRLMMLASISLWPLGGQRTPQTITTFSYNSTLHNMFRHWSHAFAYWTEIAKFYFHDRKWK